MQHDIGFKAHPSFISKVSAPVQFQCNSVTFEKPNHQNYDVIAVKKTFIAYCDFTKIDSLKINVSFVTATSSSHVQNVPSFHLYNKGAYAQYVTFHTQDFYSFNPVIAFPEHKTFNYKQATTLLENLALNNPTTQVYNKSINQSEDITNLVDPLLLARPRPASALACEQLIKNCVLTNLSDAVKLGEYLFVEIDAPDFPVEFSGSKTFNEELPKGKLVFMHKNEFAVYEASSEKVIAYSLTRELYVISKSQSNPIHI